MRVVAAIIENGKGLILLAQRPPGKALAGLWEFPGGKIEAMETPEQALHRELDEELGLRIGIENDLGIFVHTYDWGTVYLHVFVVAALNEARTTEDVQVFRWLDPRAVVAWELADADVEPLKAYLSLKTQTTN